MLSLCMIVFSCFHVLLIWRTEAVVRHTEFTHSKTGGNLRMAYLNAGLLLPAVYLKRVLSRLQGQLFSALLLSLLKSSLTAMTARILIWCFLILERRHL